MRVPAHATTYKAYDWAGNLKLETWASTPGTKKAEEKAYQERVNKGDFSKVEVIEPGKPTHVIYPEGPEAA